MTGLGLLQVKFWFQNKRTNVKVCSTPLQFWIRLYVCMFPSNSSISCNTLEFPDIFSYSYLSYFTLGISNHYYPFCYLPKQHLSGKEENYRLKVENEMLREENYIFKQAQNNPLCPRCTNDPGYLELIKELEQVKAYNRMLQQQLQVQHVTRCLK